MAVRAGREFLAIPGPTTMPDEVLRAMHRPALDIYSEQMVDLTDEPAPRSVEIVRHQGPLLHLHRQRPWRVGSGAVQRAVARRQGAGAGKRPLRDRLGQCGGRDGRRGRGAEGRLAPRHPPAEVEARLRADKDHKIKAILAAQVDTASGAYNDIEAIGKAIKAAGHPALFMVDAVASLGCMPFEMDAWGIDVAMSGSQKGLMTPPGLGFVAANDRAREVHKNAGLRTPYWDWTEREGSEHYRKYAGTAPVHLLFALRQAIDMLFEEKLENVFLRHRLLAEAVRRAVAVWAEGQVLGFNIAEAGERSNTVTTVVMGTATIRSSCINTARRNAAWCSGSGSASCRARRSGSPIWATSTRR